MSTVADRVSVNSANSEREFRSYPSRVRIKEQSTSDHGRHGLALFRKNLEVTYCLSQFMVFPKLATLGFA